MGDGVLVAVLQTAQMALVGRIQQVAGGDVQFGNLLLTDVQVGTGREAQQRIARCTRLGVVYLVIMVLRKIMLQTDSNTGIVEL